MKSLLLVFILDLCLQFLFYVPSALLKTEKLFDLSGSVTFIACAFAALFNTAVNPAPRQIIAFSLLMIWTIRLGIFLFLRVRNRPDSRFQGVRDSPSKLLVFFCLQIIWIFVTALPAYICLSSEIQPPFSILDGIGIVIWLLGFAIEAISDHQKTQWRKKRTSGFIKSGLWAYSRHPNYFGEVLLWIGMTMLCISAAVNWEYIMIISPVFTYILIRFVSGVPPLETASDQKYGDDREYLEYKHNTSVFVPFFHFC